MHTHANRSRSGANNGSNLAEAESRSVAKGKQVLLFRLEQTDNRAQLRRPFACEELLLDVRFWDGGVKGQRVAPRPPMDVPHGVSCDLEQPTSETPLTAKSSELRERGQEHRAGHVLARRIVANAHPHVAENAIEISVV